MKQQYRKIVAPSKIALAASLALVPFAAALAQVQTPAAANSTLNLEEVVITGTATRTSKMKQSVSISTMSTESIEMSVPGNAAEVLRAVPGIRTESTGGDGNANVSVRGLPSPDGGARYSQFQEDGLPIMLFGDIAFGTADSFLRVDNSLERLEVIRGGSASTFTSNAPGGIFNFISKDGDEKGGSIGLTKGLSFNRTRYDMSYGAPLSQYTRFFVGGFYRQGEGVRSAGSGAENGGQIKANITHDLGKGSFIKLNLKALNDQVPMYLPSPAVRNDSEYSSFPNYNLLTGFSVPQGLIDVAKNQYGQTVVTDASTGAKTKSTSIGGELNLNLESGWKLNDKIRISSNSGSWVGMISPNEIGTAQALAVKYGGVSAAYHNGGAVATSDPAFVGHLFNVSVKDLGNAVNDLKLSKAFNMNGGKLDASFGLFNMTQKIAMDWQWSSYLLSLNGSSPQVIDVLNGAGKSINPGGTGFANGAAVWGNCCVTSYSLNYAQTAPYASVAWEKGPINADAGLRLDNMRASGTAWFSNSVVNYSLNKPAATVGGNYRFNNDTSAFARLSHGTRFNAERVSASSAINPTTGAAVDANSLFDTVDQAELGLKMRQGNFNLFGTLFAAKTRISSFTPTPPTSLAANYDAKGIELESGYRIGGLRLGAGATFTNAKITNGADSGKTPQRQAKLVYQLTPSYTAGALTLGGALLGSSSAYAENSNQNLMPAYKMVNLFASYAIGKQATASLSVNNAFNAIAVTEVQGVGAGNGSPRVAPGRSIQGSLRYNF